MIEKHLGETIDIHAGGQDLIFPHHENEIAQSMCAHGGKPFARYWMHNGMLRVEGQKMSKSVGNVLLIHDLLEQQPAEAVRLLLMTGHYRHPLDFSEAGIDQARKNLDRIYGLLDGFDDDPAGDDDANVAAVKSALLDDLNTPKALAEIFRTAKDMEQGNTEAASLKGACWYPGHWSAGCGRLVRGYGRRRCGRRWRQSRNIDSGTQGRPAHRRTSRKPTASGTRLLVWGSCWKTDPRVPPGVSPEGWHDSALTS